VLASPLRPFFSQAIYGTALLDYGIDDISSEPVRWWVSDAQQQKLLRDVVTIHRIGDFLLPVTLEVVFSDGSRVREHWDGQDRWKSFTYLREAKVVSAEIDPDHTLLLDLNEFNNSRTVASNPVPARKITNIWTSFLQLSSQLAGWLV
jgi:hypothetical protein